MPLPIIDHPSFHDQLPLGDFETLAEVCRIAAGPGMQAIEVGCWGGKGSVLLGSICREFNGHLFCVDWWKGSNSDTGKTLSDVAKQIDVFGYWQKRIDDAGLSEFVTPIHKNSQAALANFEDESADFVFIDADHAYNAVKQDIKGYWEKLKVGGIMAGHDYDAKYTEQIRNWCDKHKDDDNVDGVHCGVIMAVNEMFPGKFSDHHRIWWVKKENAA